MPTHKNAVAALAELQRHQARGLPTEGELNGAADESHWSGKTIDGYSWKLIKVGQEDYQVDC